DLAVCRVARIQPELVVIVSFSHELLFQISKIIGPEATEGSMCDVAKMLRRNRRTPQRRPVNCGSRRRHR
ncbi:hypothetical protein ABTE74_23125, partial [Acinetobacter baumannii]